MRLKASVAALCLASLLAGCGEPSVSTGAESEATYDGPLHVARSAAQHPRAGAAGDVVQCDAFGTGGFSDEEEYGEGATADSAAQALEVARGEGGFGGVQEGLLVAKEEDDRVLYVVEVGGEVKQAVIVRDPGLEGLSPDEQRAFVGTQDDVEVWPRTVEHLGCA
jgi:hypothetical protein